MEELKDNLDAVIKTVDSLTDFKLRVNNVAQKFGCSNRTVYRLVESGDLEAIRLTPNSIRISAKSVNKYIEKRLKKNFL